MCILFKAAVDFSASERAIFGPWGWTSIVFPVFFALIAFRYFCLLLASLAYLRQEASPASAGSSSGRRPPP
jgi:hypothetical protein